MSSLPKVSVLPADLANQIAAGEVVERPASVAKELLENALDAGSTRIELSLSGGGLKELTVIDDGFGMSPGDARLALERHATSKLRAFTDLDSLCSFGFRGEALPSIASVSRFELTTREATRDEATVVTVLGGKETRHRSAGGPVGTKVSVRDLFFNVPARLKFLRSTSTESGHVSEVFVALALGRPEVTFVLSRDGRTVRKLPKVKNRKERAAQVLEREDLRHIRGERGPLRIEAFLAGPESARSGASGLRFLVNGRPVRDRALAQAVAQTYGTSLERGRYPVGVIFLDLPAHLVDINVHPQKLEVRFAEARAVFDALFGVLSKELGFTAQIELPKANAPNPRPFAREFRAPTLRGDVADTPNHPSPAAKEIRPTLRVRASTSMSASEPESIRPETLRAFELRDGAQPGRSRLRFIAQLRRSYLICEGREGLVILDQARLAERVLCAKLWSDFLEGRCRAQSLLFPVQAVVPEGLEHMLTIAPQLTQLGIEVRAKSDTVATIHSVPDALSHAPPEAVLAILSQTLRESAELSPRERLRKLTLRLGDAFCLKRGQPLGPGEAASLLANFDELDSALEGPSPILHRVSFEDLERGMSEAAPSSAPSSTESERPGPAPSSGSAESQAASDQTDARAQTDAHAPREEQNAEQPQASGERRSSEKRPRALVAPDGKRRSRQG